jgi:hypothetical protein
MKTKGLYQHPGGTHPSQSEGEGPRAQLGEGENVDRQSAGSDKFRRREH